MKTFKNYIYTGGVLMMCMLGSCSREFLEVKPKGSVIATKISDYANLLEQSFFVQLTGAGKTLNAHHILGDDVAGLEPHFNNPTYFGTENSKLQNLFMYRDDVYRPDEETDEVAGMYERIYTTNKIIDEVMDAEDGQEALKRQIRAEAYCHRAFAYFMLVNYFGMPYDPATADQALGVPLVLENNFSRENFERASVQDVYDVIIADLTAAIPDLPMMQNSANRFTKAAAQALLGKVYLFTRQFTEAAEILDEAVEHVPSRFTISGSVKMIDYNTASPGNPILGYMFVNPDVGSTASQGHGYPESLWTQPTIAMWVGNAASLVISPETYALFKPNDLRIKLFVGTYSPVAQGPSPFLPAGLLRSRAGFLGSSVGIQLPDMYLLRAEAKARTNDLAGAREDLVYLRKHRMPLADAEADIPSDQADMIRFVIEERRREFATLGFRWFDMRRLSVDTIFAGYSYSHTLYKADGSIKAVYPFDPKRFVIRFSEKLVAQSPGLVNNL